MVIDFVLKNNDIKLKDLKGYTINDILQSEQYKKMQIKQKNMISTRLNQLEKNDKNSNIQNAYFICRNCGKHEQVKPNTLITRKNYGDVETNEDIDSLQYGNMAAVKCIPITRNYICHNAKCESHKNHMKRKAKFYRIPGSFVVRYVCTTCNESWTA